MPERVGEGLSALVVDDEEVVRSVVVEVLEGMGFLATPVESLTAGRQKLAVDRYDLLVIDKNLPDGSGLSMAHEVAERSLDAQVVIISGYATLSSAVEALQTGVADFVVKPFDLADFRARLQRVIESLKLRRSYRNLFKELQEKNGILEGLATRDPLTGLDNHASFQESVRKEIERGRRYGAPCALVLASIDRFRDINASLGFSGGDALLRALGAFLLAGGRSIDVPAYLAGGDVLARYGGDTFVILLPETDRTGAATRAEHLRRTLEQAQLGRGLPRITLSLGVAAFPEHAQDADALIAAAATSLDAAKQAGRNRLICWSRELSAGGPLGSAQGRHEADKPGALERSIRERAVHSVYPPIVDLAAGTEIAWEALTRPMDPAFTSIVDVLGTAERSGQVPTLGRVLRAIQIAAIHKLPPDKLLFLNVHPFEFLEPDTIQSEPALRPWTKRVVLELTEAAEVTNFPRARQRVAALRAAGFRIAVDDLGSGYSSLNSLALLEPDFVKLDMAMIRGIEEGGRAARLIKHILEYCRGEGMQAGGEGIETPEELRVVAALGVSLVQGYLLARPGPPFPRATVELPSNPPPPKGAR